MSLRCRLPEELMIDIISTLPVKTIIRFKCVCKKWRDVVSDPHFVHLHLTRSRVALMIHDDYGPGALKWVETESDYQLVHVKTLVVDKPLVHASRGRLMYQVGSVNGLICCVQDGGAGIYVFNPVLEEYMSLPPPQPSEGLNTLSYGLGVSTAGEYKLIRIFGRETRLYPPLRIIYTVEIDLYIVGTDQWRSSRQTPYQFNLEEPTKNDYRELLRPGLHLNSHLYWLVNGQVYDFDLVTETFELFPSPPAPGDNQESKQILGVLKGSLSRFSWCSQGLEVWVMKDESWYKEITIQENISPILYSRVWRPVCLIDGFYGTSILLIYVLETRTLATYCLIANTILHHQPWSRFNDFRPYYNECLIYRPSFVKLNNFGSKKVG